MAEKKRNEREVMNFAVVKLYDRIRIVSQEGANLGEFDSKEAFEAAKAKGLDLLLITKPKNDNMLPICKILDYGKYKYTREKMQKENGKQKGQQEKELSLRPSTADGDFQIKMKQAEKMLSDGCKIKFRLRFKGRENAHKEIGFDVFNRVKEELASVGRVQQEPKLAGNTMTMAIIPL